MFVSGPVSVHEVRIKTYNDHRTAMSAAVVSFVSELEIENPEVVAKSFPTFWIQLRHIGFTITE
jgi:3-phosphoshikimate 1-carboxyvinyltransferase